MHLLDQIYNILCVQIEVAAIQKAINSIEGPIKQKHVRSAIISSFQGECGQSFWTAVSRLPIMENKIVAWKLCYVVHKVLREGHPMCLTYSQRHVKELDDTGTFWSNIKDDYGKMIRAYTKLLVSKLEFHKKYPIYSGSMDTTVEDLESMEVNGVNMYYQLVVDMMDYLDKILELQAVIFRSMDMSRANSMTKTGQCKLTPLMPCIQDASKLYNYIVKLLFKLHEKLSADILIGHTERFCQQFVILKQFYENTNKLQYFKSLINVPSLPEEPPNFSVPSYCDFETTVTLTNECLTNESLIVANLSNTASSSSQVSHDSSDILVERDNLIKHLQVNSESLKNEIAEMVSQHNAEINLLQSKINVLEHQLAARDKKNEQDIQTKVNEEKFEKMKDLYLNVVAENTELQKQKCNLEKDFNYSAQKIAALEKFCKIDDLVPEETKKLLYQALQKEQSESLEDNSCAVNHIKFSAFHIISPEIINSNDEDSESSRKRLMKKYIEELKNTVSTIMKMLDVEALLSVPKCVEYLEKLEKTSLESIFDMLYQDDTPENIIAKGNKTASTQILYMIYARVFASIVNDVTFTVGIENACDELLTCICKTFDNFNEQEVLKSSVENISVHLKNMTQLARSMINEHYSKHNVEIEISSMNAVVQEAAKKMQNILNKPEASNNIQVNEKIKQPCSQLMEHINLLILKAKCLQEEVDQNNKVDVNAKELYQKNNQWTHGFISAANAIAHSVNIFVNLADRVLTTDGKIEELVVAAQEIAASTMHLIVAGKVRAPSNCKNLLELIQVSKDVLGITNNIIFTINNCRNENNSFENLHTFQTTLHETKMLEMESQIKVLELEKRLEQERIRLSLLRKHHYQINGFT